MADRLDLVIFGATGFTGKHTVKLAAQHAKEKDIKIGIAGRRKEALEAVAKEFAPNIDNVPIIVADIDDEESLKNMTKQAKVLLNCCGPYRFLGETVVKACIATNTHHVDVSGEPWYMEKMQLDYNKAAQDAGVYIISACGFDSIPCDLGVIFTQKKFDGQINSIESYLSVSMTKPVSGAVIHYQTYASLVYGITNMKDLRPLRNKLYPEKLPTFWPKLKTRRFIHKSSISDGWSTIFPGSDRSVTMRSQRFLYDKCNQRPVQIQTYFTMKSLFSLLMLLFMGMLLSLLSKCEFGRKILLRYPSFFTLGYIDHDGPTLEAMENCHFSIIFKAKGWTEKLENATDKYKSPPNKEMITKVSAVNPGYGATCVCAVMSAIMILKESDKMPDNGGVLPPGAAFSKTSLIEELIKNDVKFEVVSSMEK